jgi:hypothetical protein
MPFLAFDRKTRQQMPDAVLACVASFEVSENTSTRRRGAALFRVKFNFLNALS